MKSTLGYLNAWQRPNIDINAYVYTPSSLVPFLKNECRKHKIVIKKEINSSHCDFKIRAYLLYAKFQFFLKQYIT